MTTPSFISDLTLDTSLAGPMPHQRAPLPLTLAHCHFNSDLYSDNAFCHCGIALPPRLMCAVIKRRSEFLAGRVCAQRALAQLDIQGTVGSIEGRRDPLWPPGATGAITHSNGIAAALAGPTHHWLSIGLDIEHWIAADSAHTLFSAILQPDELSLLPAPSDRMLVAQRLTLIFSAKETLFKALNPATGTSFYFHDASTLDITANTLTLRLDRSLNRAWPAGTHLICHYRVFSRYVMTWLAIPSRL